MFKVEKPANVARPLPRDITDRVEEGKAPAYRIAASAPSIPAGTRSFRTAETDDHFDLQPIYILPAELDNRNMYRTLYEAGTELPEYLPRLDTPTVVASPFDFGTLPREYTHGKKHSSTVTGTTRDCVMAVENNTIYTLMSYHLQESNQNSYGVIESEYDQQTGDVVINLVHLVDYDDTHPDTDKYVVRMYLEGNEVDHSFTVRSINPHVFNQNDTYLPGQYSLPYNLVGTGISQSDGGDDYFLLKWGDPQTSSTARYYKLPADATESTLRAYQQTGYSREEIAAEDTANYLAVLDDVPFFEAGSLETVEAPMSVDDFTGGTVRLQF